MNTTERAIFNLREEIDRSLSGGWTCKNPIPFKVGPFEPKLVEFLIGEEKIITGAEMVKRANEMGINTGIRHAEALIREQIIMDKTWNRHVLVFPEVWTGPGGDSVWCLYGDMKIWQIQYDELIHGFNSDYRFVSV